MTPAESALTPSPRSSRTTAMRSSISMETALSDMARLCDARQAASMRGVARRPACRLERLFRALQGRKEGRAEPLFHVGLRSLPCGNGGGQPACASLGQLYAAPAEVGVDGG